MSLTQIDRPVNNASLVFFRVCFGLVMAYQVYSLIAEGALRPMFQEPRFFFTYYGFGWVKPLDGTGIVLHFALTLLAALGIAAGCFYRTSCAVFFVGWTWYWLIDVSYYQNHTYLVSLLSFWLFFMPANGRFSVDAWWRPALRTAHTPVWCVWLLRALMAIVYFYAGLAKLNGDWLRGEPMGEFYGQHGDFPVLGGLVTSTFWTLYMVSWGGLFFDLFIVPALLWVRTRPIAFLLVLGFHGSNLVFFTIDIFPILAVAATTIFFAPEWPERVWARFTRNHDTIPAPPGGALRGHSNRALRIGLAVFLVVQLLVPFRHVFYPGDHNWTEEGHRFSWFLVQRSKKGRVLFLVHAPDSGKKFSIDPIKFLNPRQVRFVAITPDMMVQFAHFLEAELGKELPGDLEIYAVSRVRLNRRDFVPLVPQTLDLSQEPRHGGHYDWITPHPGPMLPPGSAPRAPTA